MSWFKQYFDMFKGGMQFLRIVQEMTLQTTHTLEEDTE